MPAAGRRRIYIEARPQRGFQSRLTFIDGNTVFRPYVDAVKSAASAEYLLSGVNVHDSKVAAVRLRDVTGGGEERLPTAAAFVFIGLVPNTAFLRGTVTLDAQGFVRTSQTLETSLPGVFAAGDCRQGSTKQIAAAVGEGATAALMIRHYLNAGEEARGAAEDV